MEHGAPLCHTCRSLGWGMSRCYRVGHEGHTDPAVSPKAPLQVAPGRHVLVPQNGRAGAAAQCFWLGRACPASQALLACDPRRHAGARPPPPPPKR